MGKNNNNRCIIAFMTAMAVILNSDKYYPGVVVVTAFSPLIQHTLPLGIITKTPRIHTHVLPFHARHSRGPFILHLSETSSSSSTNDISSTPSEDTSSSSSSSSSSSATKSSKKDGMRSRLKDKLLKNTPKPPSLSKSLKNIRELTATVPSGSVIGAVLRDAAAGAAEPGTIRAVLNDVASEARGTLRGVTGSAEEGGSEGIGVPAPPPVATSPATSTDNDISTSGTGATASSLSSPPPPPPEPSSDTDSDEDNDVRNRLLNAFATAEDAVLQAEQAMEAVALAKTALATAKKEALSALRELEDAAVLTATAAAAATAASSTPVTEMEPSVLTDIADLSYEDIDFSLSEMAPPFIGDDQCLVPGVPLVRVEKAPENSRRIFAGIDIAASVDDVWAALTDYDGLRDLVPNLIVNDVLELYDAAAGDTTDMTIDDTLPEEEQCRTLAEKMKGAKLRQVGGAKVVGINFSARTTLEVREWPRGLPDFAHFSDETYDGKSRQTRIQEMKQVPLRRYRFPRPFAISKLPTRDISMQSVPNDDGEFRMYQGVWRMQPLPGCAPKGQSAMRLTYAVEISPRAYLPVQLVEKRIASDLCNNLEAIRDAVTKQE